MRRRCSSPVAAPASRARTTSRQWRTAAVETPAGDARRTVSWNDRCMQNAVAFSNNDVVTIAWSYGRRPDGCMGFAIHRIDAAGNETPLPSHAVFPGYKIGPRQTTDDFPIQKFYWKDPDARLEAERTHSRTCRSKIIPVEGRAGHST